MIIHGPSPPFLSFTLRKLLLLLARYTPLFGPQIAFFALNDYWPMLEREYRPCFTSSRHGLRKDGMRHDLFNASYCFSSVTPFIELPCTTSPFSEYFKTVNALPQFSFRLSSDTRLSFI